MRNLVKGNLLSRIMIIGLFKLQLVIVAKEEGYEKRMMNKKLTIRGPERICNISISIIWWCMLKRIRKRFDYVYH